MSEPLKPALLRERQALQLIPISRETLRRLVAKGLFPAPVIRCGIKFWDAAEVQAWIDGRWPQ